VNEVERQWPPKRRWLTDKQRDFNARMSSEVKAIDAAHTAKYGPHVCEPDPNDPWSVCDLEKPVRPDQRPS
jgi:hypothetical protein